MKNRIFIFGIMILLLIVTGCGRMTPSKITRELEKKIGNLKAYHLTGVLELSNNDDVYTYDVDVAYKSKDKYKVILTNKSNKHEQIILKNEDGVYVMTQESLQ